MSATARASTAAIRAALSEHARAAGQRVQLDRLRAELAATDLVELPYLFAPEIGLAELELIAEHLSRELSGLGAAAA